MAKRSHKNMATSSVFVSQSVMFTMAAAPPSIQQAALHRPVLEKAEAATTITPDAIASALAIALTVSHSSFLITGLLVPCSLFLAAATHALLISRALLALGSGQAAVLLFTLLPFASRKDILLALLISAARMALMLVTSPLLSTIAVESVAIIFAAQDVAAGRRDHHYLIAATAMGLCAAADYELQVFMFCFYCAVAAIKVFRLVQPYVAK